MSDLQAKIIEGNMSLNFSHGNDDIMIEEKKRIKVARTIIITSLIINLFLAVGKIAISIIGGSTSLLADGFDSTLDVIATAFSFIALKIAITPADEDHHFGHEKYENLFSIGIALLLFVSSGIIGYQAINRLILRQVFEFSVYSVIIASTSIVMKGVLVWLNLHIGKKIKSPVLVASGLNFRTDVLTSIVVLVSVTVGPLSIGSFSLFWVDSSIALIISIVIIITAINISRESLAVLLDQSPDKETIDEIMEIIKKQEGVKEVDKLRARTVGPRIISDVHIYVDQNITVEEGHEIAELVSEKVCEELPSVKEMLVHVEPFIEEKKSKQQLEENANIE